ncbi:hypothetical protein ACH5RR_038492 [Cinchona calisaya]|uniref:NOT transcription complex subunit VIP2 n=1 Tax=Cinchona calisaya TaxID=153742 RepID=A0ABD2Y147_9GENT
MMSGLLNSGMSGSNSNLPDATGRAFPSQTGSTSAVLNHSGGNIQGLHGIHGNFNISNMPGTFASRNSTMLGGAPGGVQQVSGSGSSGRFTINNLPAALSQLSLASSHGHSGVTNNGGSGALANLGNSGRVANPMANYVSGGNIARGLSSGGGSNLPGVASRLNLTDPQVVSMLGSSYSAAGVPFSRNQFQAGNGPFTSLLLNDLNAHEDPTFDINDFPQLAGRPSSAGGSQGQIGFLRKQNVGFSQQNQEFSIQNEDFPALPGYKGGNVEFPMNVHQKEQLHSMSSMMHPQNMPLGRSTGLNFGGASSSHYQQPQQHASSTNGSGLSFLPTNYQNYQDIHFHDPEARTVGQPASGSGPANLPNTVPGIGSYEQLPQQYQQFQKQSYFRLGTPFRDQDVKPLQATQAPADKFGMLGLLSVIKMVNPALTSLALGIDLTTLGLNLNSSESIHKKFASPWSDEPAKGEPEYNVPECYYAEQPPALKQSYFSKFRLETLFYIFYSMPKDEAQLCAANELYNRGWFYHRDLRLWFARAKNMEPLVKTPTHERGSYLCFDPNTWETVRKDNFVLQYDMIEKRSSGREASIVAEIVEVEENSSSNMRTLRVPPVITVNKSAAYALYHLTYIRDVAYKPEEFYVDTRKCEPDAGADVVKICERQVINHWLPSFLGSHYLLRNIILKLRDENGHIIEHTQPTCCPCGDQRRVPSSCGNFFDKMVKGKANTAHCLRFPGDWFHVFGIGQSSVGFTVRIEVKTRSRISEVILGPENRTATSSDNFLKANLVGDYVGYTSIPSFDNFYLVVPRQGDPGQPHTLGRNFSKWMLLERVRFTLDGLECDKIGVSYGAFNGQPDFCSSPYWSCLHNQLWNFWDADQNRISRNQVPLYSVQGRFERINHHPNADGQAFSIGITEVLNTNLLIELSADDIEYVYQRSPGKILSITVPTFEALTQFGTATITTKNIGEVEASYSLTFDCSIGVSQMEEQFYIMKPNEIITRSFKLYPTSDQASRYVCAAILKDSGFSEVDRAECQFTTTATVVDNGSQISFQPPKTSINGFFESIEELWKKLWNGLKEFVTGKSCRNNCGGFFDFGCHVQYICMSWVVLFGLLLAIFPTVIVLFWLLHQKGLFDPFYDWLEDHLWASESRRIDMWKHGVNSDLSKLHLKKNYKYEERFDKHHPHKRQRSARTHHKHNHVMGETNYYYHLHHVHKDRHNKHGKTKSSGIRSQGRFDRGKDDKFGLHRQSKEREIIEGITAGARHHDGDREKHLKNKNVLIDDVYYNVPGKWN